MIAPAGKRALLSLLAWYRDMGADTAVAASPTDWLARGAEKTAPPPKPPAGSALAAGARTVPARREAAAPALASPAARPLAGHAAAASAAREAAAAATTLTSLEAAVRAFNGCALKATAKNTCFYRGAPQARIFIIGEAPGREEDLEGKPFVGPAGRLLDKMLAAIGLSEENVHITNVVYWRPPGNRVPAPEEAEACRPFLERQIELVAPEFLMLFGGAAAKHILTTAEGIMRLRGRWQNVHIGGRVRPVLPTLHPAYLLRTPAAKRLAWRDLLILRQALMDSTVSAAGAQPEAGAEGA